MKLTISLNSSATLYSRESFAKMLRLAADTIEASPAQIDSTLYDSTMTRVGRLTLTGAPPAPVAAAPAQLQ